jgi:hypothetical protein
MKLRALEDWNACSNPDLGIPQTGVIFLKLNFFDSLHIRHILFKMRSYTNLNKKTQGPRNLKSRPGSAWRWECLQAAIS